MQTFPRPVTWVYSLRSAMRGSTRVERCAGTYAASIATPANIVAATNVVGSGGVRHRDHRLVRDCDAHRLFGDYASRGYLLDSACVRCGFWIHAVAALGVNCRTRRFQEGFDCPCARRMNSA
jgi:hypothetical protein